MARRTARRTEPLRRDSGSPPAMAVAAMTLVQTVGRLETRPSRSRVPSAGKVAVTFIREFPKDEGKLARDVVRFRASFQVPREHVPGVGLDLEMGRERLRPHPAKRRHENVLGRAEVAEALKEDGHVAMDAPLPWRGARLEGLEGLRQIDEARQPAVAAHDNL